MKQFLFGLAALSLVVTPFTTSAQLASPMPLTGFAWSSNVGWLSMSGPGYSVDIEIDGSLDGYGWSSNLGWLKFGGLSGFPASGGNATFDTATNELSGWARFCSGTEETTTVIPGATSSVAYEPVVAESSSIAIGYGSDQYGFAMSEDGTKMYTTDGITRLIQQFTLSTPFDISTATRDGQMSLSATAWPMGFTLSPDGMNLYVSDTNSPDRIDQYRLNVANDLMSGGSHVHDFGISSTNGSPRDIEFSADGLTMIVTEGHVGDVEQYLLSTPYDISTATHDHTLDFSPYDEWPHSSEFNDDGTAIVIAANWRAVTYELSTPYDIATATPIDVVNGGIGGFGLQFMPGGTGYIVLSQNDQPILQYDIVNPYELSGTYEVAEPDTVVTGPGDCSSMNDSETGWDGWVSLNCENTGTCGTSDYQATLTGGSVSGYAWGGDIVGWLRWSGSGYSVKYTPPCTPSLQCSMDGLSVESEDQWCQVSTVQDCAASGNICSAGACIADSPTGSISLSPAAVRTGGRTSISWSSPSSTSCTVEQQNAAGNAYQSWTGVTGTDESSNPVNQFTTFSLQCTTSGDPALETEIASTSIQIIPTTIET